MADDFTGANDVGIQLNRYGIDVVSTVNGFNGADVVIYNTESRNILGIYAKKIVAEEFKKMKLRGFDFFYKKIDSTLRGNIYEEIEAISENIESYEKIAVVAAFPSMGRVIRNGEHFLNGEKLVNTEIAKDHLTPVKEGNLKKIFKNYIHVSMGEIRSGKAKLKIDNSIEKVVIFDSETEEELNLVAKFIVESGIDRYIAGSAGIMNYLPKLWGIKNRIVIISGSCSEVSIRQIDEFIKKNSENLEVFKLNITNRKIENKSYKTQKDIVIRSIERREEVENTIKKIQSEGVSKQSAGGIISDFIATESLKYIEENNIKNIIILGGETSFKVLKKLNISGLKIEFEIETGIAVAKSENMRYNIIVKPGNFGSENCIKRCYDILKNRKI
jgi:D-threonate/D-erythronate kinase